MSCSERWAHEALEQLMLGELDAAGVQRLRAHAGGCDFCRQQYDRRARTEAFLSGSAGHVGGLSAAKRDALAAQLLARVAAAEAEAPRAVQAAARVTERRPSWSSRWRMLLAPAALAFAALAVVVFVPRGAVPADGVGVGGVDVDGYQARGGERPETPAGAAVFGVRAFCVAPGAAGGSPGPTGVQAEAGPGGSLRCAAGNRLQFTATATRAARLELEGVRAMGADGEAGEPLQFVSAGDPDAHLREGVDLALPFSTPVSASWLDAPIEVRARFHHPETGAVLGESALTLLP